MYTKRIVNILSAFVLLGSMLPSLHVNAAFEDEAYNLVTTFFDDAGTTRAFAWNALTTHTDMVIQYGKKGFWTSSKTEKIATYTEYADKLFYKVDIDGLERGTDYIYRIGDPKDSIWSPFYEFSTEEENLEEFSFIGISDPQGASWGDYDYVQRTIKASIKDTPDAKFMVDLGDLVEHGEDETYWKDFFIAGKGVFESIPHMAVVGNHDTYGTDAGKNFSLHFNNPDNADGCMDGFTDFDSLELEDTKKIIENIDDTVYSFEYGNAYFAVLNSGSHVSMNDSYAILEEQAKWLKDDIKSTDKKWKFVLVHQSVYPARTVRWGTRGVLEDVIDECGIDLVLQGHDHIVTRTYPMRNGKIMDTNTFYRIQKNVGTVYTILGSCGIKRYSVSATTPDYAQVLNSTHPYMPSFTTFKVNNDCVEVITKQIDGLVVDSFVIEDTE